MKKLMILLMILTSSSIFGQFELAKLDILVIGGEEYSVYDPVEGKSILKGDMLSFQWEKVKRNLYSKIQDDIDFRRRKRKSVALKKFYLERSRDDCYWYSDDIQELKHGKGDKFRIYFEEFDTSVGDLNGELLVSYIKMGARGYLVWRVNFKTRYTELQWSDIKRAIDGMEYNYNITLSNKEIETKGDKITTSYFVNSNDVQYAFYYYKNIKTGVYTGVQLYIETLLLRDDADVQLNEVSNSFDNW